MANKKKEKIFLAIDIGNTSIAVGILCRGKVLAEDHVVTSLSSTQLASSFRQLLDSIHRKFGLPENIVICSVVPAVSKSIEKIIKVHWKRQLLLIGRDCFVPIKNNYRNPGQVGQDRLVGAYAAKCIYGYPLIIIDFGTAITFDVVSASGEYEGGMIVPGIRLSAEALFNKTALLPRIEKIQSPKNLIGKNTRESILSGLFFGYGAMVGGLIEMIARKIRGRVKVIVTGGYAEPMKKFIISKVDRIDQYLVYKGIYFVFQKAAPK